MRSSLAPVLALALVLLLGCATPSRTSGDEPTRAPVETNSTIVTPTPEASQDAVVFLFDQSYQSQTEHLTRSFTVEKGHWLCVVTNLTVPQGEAVVALEGPQGSGWQTLANASKPDQDVMVPWLEGPFVVHLNLTAFTGRVAINVTNEA